MLNDLPACTRVVAARAGAVQCTSRPWRRGGYACNGSCSWPASRRSTPASNARRPNGQRATDFRKLYRDRMLLLSPIVGCQADLFRSRRNAEPSCMHRPGARRLRAAKRYPPTVMTPAPISAASLRLQDPPQPGLRCISAFLQSSWPARPRKRHHRQRRHQLPGSPAALTVAAEFRSPVLHIGMP
jgi:hypothetical protein